MAIPLYLAKTAAEFASAQEQPTHLAWMACHFSPYGTGLTNVPTDLPKGSLLILNDRTPVHGHDPVRIRETLEEAVTALGCCGVLLDFQRPDYEEAKEIARELLNLPCPVCVSDIYAREHNCPVFLPPIPLTTPPEEYLAPWQGREIWLEAAACCAAITITESGCKETPYQSDGAFPFWDEALYCHYRIELLDDSVRFFLSRNKDDLTRLLENSAVFGVTQAVGLWQELIDDSPALP